MLVPILINQSIDLKPNYFFIHQNHTINPDINLLHKIKIYCKIGFIFAPFKSPLDARTMIYTHVVKELNKGNTKSPLKFLKF